MAWIASLAQDGCDFSRLTGPSVAALTGSDAIPWVEVGINAYRQPEYFPETDTWRIQYTGKCIDYSGEIPDVFWTFSKVFSFIALVFGGGGALFLWFSSCFVFGPGTWRWAGYEILAASVFQVLSFLWFLTDMCASEGNICTMFFGAKSDIVASSLWFISALSIFFRYPTPTRKINRRMAVEMANNQDVSHAVMNLTPDWNNRAIHLDDVNIGSHRDFD